MRNYRPNEGARRKTAERYGTPKYAYPALGPAAFWPIPPQFSNISGARRPFPNAQMGEGGGEMRNHRRNQRGAAGRQGALRNLTERLNFDIPHWDPPCFIGFPRIM